jgi:S-adenosylmethionine:tRNA-ribosyltransferase-isomerase (queuine synthetase)
VASTDLTLAVSLGALERLARPARALEDATTWTSHVGIVSSEPSYIERRRVREAGYHQEFLSGPRSIAEALSAVRGHFETERYVFVGTDVTAGKVETAPGWVYQSVTGATKAADWRLEETSVADDDWP